VLYTYFIHLVVSEHTTVDVSRHSTRQRDPLSTSAADRSRRRRYQKLHVRFPASVSILYSMQTEHFVGLFQNTTTTFFKPVRSCGKKYTPGEILAAPM